MFFLIDPLGLLTRPSSRQIPKDWVGTLSPRASSWRSEAGSPSIKECLGAGGGVALMILYVSLPGSVLCVVLTAMLTAKSFKDGLATFLQVGTIFGAILLLIALGMAIWLSWMAAEPRTIEFSFDARDRMLRRTIGKLWGRREQVECSFDSIESIRPLYLNSYADAGSFRIDGWLDLGHDIASTELETHLDWLRGHLADVVQPELRLDL